MRKIRICADTESATSLHISDAATGEPVDNVARIEVVLTPVGWIRALVTLRKRGEDGMASREVVENAPMEIDVVARAEEDKG